MHEKINEEVYFIQGRRNDSNSILVLGDEPFIIDTGTGMLFPELAQDLNALGVNTKIDVVNTHCHFDHIGGNHFFQRKVFAHELDAKHIQDADDYTQKQLFGLPLEKQDVETLGKEFRDWEVLHTPGHTEGSICLLKDGILVSGDTVFAEGYGRTDLLGGDESQLQESLEIIQCLEYEILLPGHGTLK